MIINMAYCCDIEIFTYKYLPRYLLRISKSAAVATPLGINKAIKFKFNSFEQHMINRLDL